MPPAVVGQPRDPCLMFNRRSIRTGTGVADVVPAAGESVWGVLYEVDDAELALLDRKEGYDWAYVREPLAAELAGDGSRQRAVTYTVRDKEPVEVNPSNDYLEGIISAAIERGLPSGYVDSLKRLRGGIAATDT